MAQVSTSYAVGTPGCSPRFLWLRKDEGGRCTLHLCYTFPFWLIFNDTHNWFIFSPQRTQMKVENKANTRNNFFTLKVGHPTPPPSQSISPWMDCSSGTVWFPTASLLSVSNCRLRPKNSLHILWSIHSSFPDCPLNLRILLPLQWDEFHSLLYLMFPKQAVTKGDLFLHP